MSGLTTPDVMKENQNYIRKKKPVNFTMADLAADAEEENDEKFKIANVYPSEQRSLLSKRNCTKKVVYNDGNESDTDVYEENDGTKH